MADSYHDIENRIKNALRALNRDNIHNILAAAREFDVLCLRLYHRFHGRPAKSDLQNHNRRLIDPEETTLYQYLDHLNHLKLPMKRRSRTQPNPRIEDREPNPTQPKGRKLITQPNP